MKEYIANKEYTLCDRCGVSLNDQKGLKLLLFDRRTTITDFLDDGIAYTNMDLCPECVEALNNWFDEFTSNEADVEDIATE